MIDKKKIDKQALDSIVLVAKKNKLYPVKKKVIQALIDMYIIGAKNMYENLKE